MPFRLWYIFSLVFAFQCIGEIWAQEEGFASYYHSRCHGKRSSIGRPHDRDELVAAHRTLPFGTFVKVINLANKKTSIVCITDRGPHTKRRIIDVSKEVAKKLGFIGRGVARVRIEVIPCPLDMRYLDLIYPKIPYWDVDYLQTIPPYRVNYK